SCLLLLSSAFCLLPPAYCLLLVPSDSCLLPAARLCYPKVPFFMEEKQTHLEETCPNCGSSESEPDATFCQTCGSKLDSALLHPPAPPPPSEPGKLIAGRFVVQSLLWTAPT